MENKKDALKKLIAEFDGFAERGNKVVKNIKPADASKIVLTSSPFTPNKDKNKIAK